MTPQAHLSAQTLQLLADQKAEDPRTVVDIAREHLGDVLQLMRFRCEVPSERLVDAFLLLEFALQLLPERVLVPALVEAWELPHE